jgi:hypothetical protein
MKRAVTFNLPDEGTCKLAGSLVLMEDPTQLIVCVNCKSFFIVLCRKVILSSATPVTGYRSCHRPSYKFSLSWIEESAEEVWQIKGRCSEKSQRKVRKTLFKHFSSHTGHCKEELSLKFTDASCAELSATQLSSNITVMYKVCIHIPWHSNNTTSYLRTEVMKRLPVVSISIISIYADNPKYIWNPQIWIVWWNYDCSNETFSRRGRIMRLSAWRTSSRPWAVQQNGTV